MDIIFREQYLNQVKETKFIFQYCDIIKGCKDEMKQPVDKELGLPTLVMMLEYR